MAETDDTQLLSLNDFQQVSHFTEDKNIMIWEAGDEDPSKISGTNFIASMRQMFVEGVNAFLQVDYFSQSAPTVPDPNGGETWVSYDGKFYVWDGSWVFQTLADENTVYIADAAMPIGIKRRYSVIFRNGTYILLSLVDLANSINDTAPTSTTTTFSSKKLTELLADEKDPVFNAWLIDNAAYLQILLDDAPTNPSTKFLNGLRQWVDVAVVGGSVEHDDTLNKNGNPDFLHITETEKTNFVTASDFVEDFISNATDITHEELLNLINNNELIPSSSYRITNYTTTTGQADTTSAGHDFDIIVTALSTNKLSENAKCVRKSGDTYFENAKLEAWEIKYCIDNDTSRFAWAFTNAHINVSYGTDPIYNLQETKFVKNNVEYFTWKNSENVSLYSIKENPSAAEALYDDGDPDMYHFSPGELPFNSLNIPKGVIYYMKDEWNNECPYDFKNIQFKRYPIISMSDGSTELVFDVDNQKMKYALKDSGDNIYPTGAAIDENNASYYFTFNAILQDSGTYDIYDASVIQNGIKNDEGGDFVVQNNKINEAHTSLDNPYDYGQLLKLNNIVINNIINSLQYTELSYGCGSNKFGNNCNSNTFGNNCNSNKFGNNCYSNTFGNNCFSNTFGDECYSNTFGDFCNSNKFGNNCYSNTFGNNCNFNGFGDNCYSNTFGDFCYSNTFGDECGSNKFGNNCNSNKFGNNCGSNKFGNGCFSNTFGDECIFNNFYHGISGTTKKDYISYIVLEDGCRNNNFYSTLTTSYKSFLQRIKIKGLDNDTPTNIQITLSEVNTKYEWVIAKNSSGVIKQYCPDDNLTNNDTYKIEDTSVTTWVASTKYVDFGYQAQINIIDLSESDFVNVVFGVNEAVSGNYAPAIEQYAGYILVFAKVNTAITIPTISVTKIVL